MVLPPLIAPSVFADIPANLVEAVRLGDAGANTSVAQITKIDLDGTVTFSPIGWQDVGNGIFVKFGAYGAAAFNTGTTSVGSLLGAGWTNLGNGIFQKDVISSATGLSETIRVSIAADTLTYALNNAKADGLGPGEHPTETFSIVVVDNDGQTASTTVVYTVDGRNDPPDLSPDPGPHNVSETSNTTSGDGSLGLAGTLTFTDPELGQTHSVDPFFRDAVWSGASSGHTIPSVTQAAIVSALQASLLNDSTGTGTGRVSWNFVLPDHLVDFLRAGETLTLTYNVITVRDSLDAVSSQPVTIVITGTNDRPVLAEIPFPIVPVDEPTDAAATPLFVGSYLEFTDVDLNDSHAANAALIDSGVVWSGGSTIPFASLAAVSVAMTASIFSPSTHAGTGSLFWTFNIGDNHYLDFLGVSETLTLTYAVSVVDNSGAANAASVTENVTLVITGTNDAPVLADAIADQTSPEDAPWTFHVPAGTFADIDSALTYSATLGDNSELPSWLTFDETTQTFSGTPPTGFSGPFDLKVIAADGEFSVSETFTLNVSPGGGDAPVLTYEPHPPANVVEDSVDASASGVIITVTDPGDTVHYDMTGWLPVIPTSLGATEFDGHYYLYINASLSWTAAQVYAASLGGYLVNITSAAENDFVHNNVTGSVSAWIGATDSGEEGKWVWTGGPEAGEQFWQGAGPAAGGTALGYANWWGT